MRRRPSRCASPYPTVSVVIPAYQSGETVGAAISSVLTQQFSPHEVIVVDDGSSDGTASIVSGYRDHVQLISQSNRGPSEARNTGWRASSGELVAFVDADDILFPSYLQDGVERWRRAGGSRSIVVMNAYFLRHGIDFTRQILSVCPPRATAQRKAMLESNIATMFCLVPRDVLDELDGFDKDLPAVEDWDFMLRAVLIGVELLFVSRPHALYRWRPGSQSSELERMYSSEERMFRKILATGVLSEGEQAYVESRVRTGSPRALRAQADAAVLRADYRLARSLYGQASRMSPRDLKLRARWISMMWMPGVGILWRRRMSGDNRVA